jgi:hypothetical protein
MGLTPMTSNCSRPCYRSSTNSVGHSLGERIADVDLKPKPTLVIVSNENIRTVVSLSLVWRVTQRVPGRRGITSRGEARHLAGATTPTVQAEPQRWWPSPRALSL